MASKFPDCSQVEHSINWMDGNNVIQLKPIDRQKAKHANFEVLWCDEIIPSQAKHDFYIPRPPQLAASFIIDQTRYVAYWHKREVPTPSSNVRVYGHSGKHILVLSSSHLDPGRVKTFFIFQELHAAWRDPRRRDHLRIFWLYRVWSKSGRNLGPRSAT